MGTETAVLLIIVSIALVAAVVATAIKIKSNIKQIKRTYKDIDE